MSNQAIVIKQAKEARIEEVSVPKLRPDYILVETKAVAINPTDWKHVDYLADPGARVGCDYAGIVLEVGSDVTKDLKKGDRVAGFTHGGNAVYHEDGAFQKTITAKGDVQMKIPENLSFEEASTLGVGITTVGQGLYQSLKLPLPGKQGSEKIPVLIYGGSTATGALAIQYAKLSGCDVYTTCSEANFDYVKSLGATKAFDYKSKTCADEIKAATENKLKHAFDCISEGVSAEICAAAMSTDGNGVISLLLPYDADKIKAKNASVKSQNTLGYTVVGEAFKFGPNSIPAKPEDFEFGKDFWNLSTGLLAEGKIKVHKPSVNEGGKGLEGALHGMQLLREGKVSGKKLVYTM